MKKKLVYISHPFGNNPDNLKDIERIIKFLYADERLYNTFCFVSPVHTFGFMYEMYDGDNYYKGLQLCLDMLDYCNMMLMVGNWETSKGCVGEKAHCDNNSIPYLIVRTSDELVNASYDMIYDTLISEVAHGQETEEI